MLVEEKTPLITIGVLNFNGEKYIKETIPPLLSLNYPSYEILVVDNASSDGSLEYLAGFNNKIRLIKNDSNLGYCVAKNQIVKKARGEYVLLLDEDTLIDNRDCLFKFLNFYQEKRCGFICPLLVNKGEKTTSIYGGFWSPFAYGLRPKEEVFKIRKLKKAYAEVVSVEGQAVFFKRNHFLEIGGYDEKQPYYLDVGDINIRSYILTGKKNYSLYNLCFVHLGVQRKVDNKKWAWKLQYMFPGAMRILWKNFTLKNALLFSPAIFLFYFCGSLYQTVKRRSFLVIKSFIWSFLFFLKSFPNTIKERKKIQGKRVIKSDLFLKIKKPSF